MELTIFIFHLETQITQHSSGSLKKYHSLVQNSSRVKQYTLFNAGQRENRTLRFGGRRMLKPK